MAQSNKDFYKISAIVDQFLIDNDLPNNFFPKGLSWALRGLREIRLDSFQEVKSVVLPVTERKTVILPNDYCDWCKIGIQYGQYIITLGVNDELTTLARTNSSTSVAGLLSQHMPNGLNFDQYEGYYSYGGNNSTFWMGGGLPSKGYFKVFDDGNCRQLLMDYDYGFEDVLLEYITDGLDPCGDTVIHPYEVDFIIKYIDELFERKNNPKATNWSKNEASKDVFWAEKKLRARRNKITPQDILNITRQEARMTPHL